MASSPVCTIDETGLHRPAFEECRAYVEDGFKGIYGQDIYLGSDSQDGELVGLVATALHDANAMCAQAYNSFSPISAQGVGLSRVVKVNGLGRAIATYSTADLRVVGQAGTVIEGGIAQDAAGFRWALLSTVTIPLSGEITATATCTTLGAVRAAAGAITAIATPTAGWQSVTNLSPATPGAPVERDAALRQRQAVSTALPSATVLEGIVGGILAIPGVTRVKAYENDTKIPDANGLPGNSIALVVDGGSAEAIARVIQTKKTPGAATFGTTALIVSDRYGLPNTIRFTRPLPVPITFRVTIRRLSGYTSEVDPAIRAALADFVNALGIGTGVPILHAAEPARLPIGNPLRGRFELTKIEVARGGSNPTQADIAIGPFEEAYCDAGLVKILNVP